ncbi:hypothetical protein Tco_0471202 [Tanacetum coccineum]
METTEKEFAELGGLRGRVSQLEDEVVAKSEEITSLNRHNAELLRVDCENLRSEIDGEAKLREEFASLQDAAARRFEEQSAKLDARIADIKRDMDTDLYPHMLTAIAGRRWVLGHGIHLVVMKCAQYSECRSAMGKVISLAQVEAYDLDVENKYMAAVSDFKNVSFSLFEELEALKDSPLALSMPALTMEGDADSTRMLRELHPSLD